MKRDKTYLKNFNSLIDSMMSAKINGKVDNATDKSGTDAADVESEQIISSLWNDTFISYEPMKVVKMPYYFQLHVNQPPGLTISNQFKVNSTYDFDLTGTGHQPLGRDTWASIYDYYKVLETHLHVTHTSTQYATGTIGATSGLTDANAGPNYMSPTYVGGMLDITATPPSTLTQWQEVSVVSANSQCRFTPIQILERIGSRNNTTTHYSMVWKPEMFDTAIINDATMNTWTPVGSDPQNLNYFSDIVYNSNAAGNNIHYSIQVKAMMLVAFKNVRRDLLYTTN